jgi:haloalkane dehalogenase
MTSFTPITRRHALRTIAALPAVTSLVLSACGGSDSEPAFGGYDYQARYADIPQGRMHYVDEGSGPPVVMLHGVPTWSYLWRNVIPYVSATHRAIAPDMLNHGKSSKSPALGFIDHYRNFERFVGALGLDRMVLALHDWGSPIGFLYAARHPEKVKGLIFLEAALGPAPSEQALPPPIQAMRGPAGFDLVVKQNFFIETILPQTIPGLSPAAFAAYKAPFAREEDRLQLLQWPREVAVVGDGTANLPLFAEYAQFLATSTLPKLLIHATPGFVITPDAVQFARATYPNLSTSSVGSGIHFLQEDQPSAVGLSMSRWLRELA